MCLVMLSNGSLLCDDGFVRGGFVRRVEYYMTTNIRATTPSLDLLMLETSILL